MKNKNYNSKKITTLYLTISLDLFIYETEDLLSKGVYSLSKNYKFDLIIGCFIKNENYDIFLLINHYYK